MTGGKKHNFVVITSVLFFISFKLLVSLQLIISKLNFTNIKENVK